MNENNQLHLDVYLDHSEFYHNGEKTIYEEGRQTKAAQDRYAKVTKALNDGYLYDIYDSCGEIDTSDLSDEFKALLKTLVDGITSEVGRALVGLTFLQITIKAIAHDQSIRLHKGSTRVGSFSWKEGISMRTLDSNYFGPFWREKGLLNINKYGIMMTRSLAENYPYSKLYKAEMRGPFDTWISAVDALESGKVNGQSALAYIMSLLINRSLKFEALANETLMILNDHGKYRYETVFKILESFFTNTQYSARAFEVVIHGFMQAYTRLGFSELTLEPISQMRSANKKHGNVGDIEMKDGRFIIEAWDAKYGKSYLFDELSELEDKLIASNGVQLAGFIVNEKIEMKPEIITKMNDVSLITETDIYLFTFKEWVEFKLIGINHDKLDEFANEWIRAVVESFARKRLDIAPIDEPCEGWLLDLSQLLKD